jgi:hypothetical protein
VLLIFQAFLIWAITGPKELTSIESTEITRRRRLKGNIQSLLLFPSGAGLRDGTVWLIGWVTFSSLNLMGKRMFPASGIIGDDAIPETGVHSSGVPILLDFRARFQAQRFQELDERAFRIARDAMLALPAIESPLGVSVVEEADGLYRMARRQGLTIRSSVDCLIAACALQHGLTVLHSDRDYPQLAKVSALQQRRV